MSTMIDQTSFKRYARIVRSTIPGSLGIALCDSKGRAVQHFNFGSEKKMLPAVEQLRVRIGSIGESKTAQAHRVSNQILLAAGLSNGQLEMVGSLAILLTEIRDKSKVGRLFRAVAECIEHEISQDCVLDAMTNELTERYEELNLVYHTEDQVNHFQQGQQALKDLTQNCLDYLDVDFAVLVSNSKDIKISMAGSRQQTKGDAEILSRLGGDICDYIMESGESLALDGPRDPNTPEGLPLVSHNVLCCPVLDTKGNTTGVLATANSVDKRIFTNSDRNLIQVMARKASKIISANYDALTGLMIRNGFEYYVESALELAKATGTESAVFHINIDQLHMINDSISHAAGDAVIAGVAAIIDSQKGELDILGRMGGDEFGLLVHDCVPEDAEKYGHRVREKIEASRIEFEGEEFGVTVSIGMAMATPEVESVAQLVAAAEVACSVAKEHGQNRIQAYGLENTGIIRRSEELNSVGKIHSALAENRFVLFGQPIHPLDPENRDHHTEVLIRLLGEDGELHAPDLFIPAAERYHLMPSIDKWVITESLAMLARADKKVLAGGTFSINLSGQSLCEPGFLQYVHEEIQSQQIPPECLCFEVTETAAVANLKEASRFMESLAAIGCSFSLDDFGAGISSFGYLKQLPVNLLKIDGAIVRDIALDETSRAMVVAINEVGHAMRLRTIAEFAENKETVARLTEIGVDYVQGYATGEPGPLADRLQELKARLTAVAS